VKAFKLSESGVNKAIKGVVNSILKGGEQITTRFKALKPFRHYYSAI
jgi:hypothetical protein